MLPMTRLIRVPPCRRYRTRSPFTCKSIPLISRIDPAEPTGWGGM